MNAADELQDVADRQGQLRGVEVVIEDVTKIYETREGSEVSALAPTNLSIKAGEFVAIVGPSGCGKSTMLSLIAGLTPKSSGHFTIAGAEARRTHPTISVVFQTDLLLYWRTIIDNIMLPVEIKRWKKSNYLPHAYRLLEQVGLEGFGGKYPSELSGGMRQRVSICRALIQQPGLLLMDEPFGALDALTREQMILDLQTMWASLGNTVIFVTHSIEEAVFLADRVIVMSPRPGRIDLDMKIAVARPRSWKSRTDRQFIDYMTRIREVFELRGVLAKTPA
jgi:NitT/TauT family transport system ATP-binding protein